MRRRAGYDQTLFQGFSVNGEADLDLQYAMALVGATQNVTLYQAGDLYEGAFTTHSVVYNADNTS